MVVVTTGSTPYLGGPQTWIPLRHAAPDLDFVEIDPLMLDVTTTYAHAVRDAVDAILDEAEVIVAHGGAARIVLECVAIGRPELPVLLLSPQIVRRTNVFIRLVRALFGAPPLSTLLLSYARGKYGRLIAKRDNLRKPISLVASAAPNWETLVDEAYARVRMPQMRRVIDGTIEFLQEQLTPIDPRLFAAVTHRTVLVGTGPFDRKTTRQMPATVIVSKSRATMLNALMLEAPDAVAAELRALLDPQRDASLTNP